MSTNENQETIADIAAFIRKCLDLLDNELSRKSNGETSMSAEALLCPVLNAKAALNRIEAAWKLEKSQSWHHREMEELILRHEKEVIELKKQIGNSAAMREALDDIIDKIDAWRSDGSMEHWQYSQLFDIADTALSAPPRNCDRFNIVKDAAIAFARERQDAPQPCPDFTFSAWLFETAAERKGEGDGR